MNLVWRGALLSAVAFFGLSAAASVRAQGPAPAQPQLAENIFKNVQFLKGLPVDEFMDTMGMFAAATAKDCTGCHSPEILTGSRDAFAVATPMIQKARGMIAMTATINRSYFQGQRRVTCFTCHTNTSNPGRVPNLAIQYGEPLADNPNALDFIALPDLANQVDQIFAKYLQAIGGAQRLNAVTSVVATGTYAGWDTARAEVPVEIYAKSPNQVTTIVRRHEGVNTWVFDGNNAWFAGIDAAASNLVMSLTGGNLAGARTDAMVILAPQNIQRAYSRWQVSEGLVDDTPVQILQGSNQGEMPINLYFDDSGTLVRLMRWNDTAVGPIPIQFDFSDYRDVNGIRRPFQWVKTWTNNRATFVMKDIRSNVPIEAARFSRPTPVVIPDVSR